MLAGGRGVGIVAEGIMHFEAALYNAAIRIPCFAKGELLDCKFVTFCEVERWCLCARARASVRVSARSFSRFQVV